MTTNTKMKKIKLPPNPFLHEIFELTSKQRTKVKKVEVLKKYEDLSLKHLFKWNFDSTIISILPEGEVPYTPNESPEGTEHTILEKEARLLHHFFKGGSNVSQVKRETMFVQMLEGLNSGEAEALVLAKDKKIGKRWKITKACVSEAYPSIVWGNRS